ncbi:hypothetical protein SAMN06264364_1308 [Quadrisphaera granulorum]|uniref:Uncharacterized protein n=1 Tax=Quadrisphaera granulorum TaxID=317664 RepID=A0A315ZUX4_9ACTN|nr:hypothetical protein [Quadrisphaera granulorum]PWJ48444.1 hypothetical protein BXY45_1308 [Quadrisphaera granulorum]SZE98403.1 hypothetical protein SAMN06264364_1308 [Quadrisphaera granulorum]
MTSLARNLHAAAQGHGLADLRIDVHRELTPGHSHPLQEWTATFRAVQLAEGQTVTLGTADLWIGDIYDADLVNAADEMHGDLVTVVEAVVTELDALDDRPDSPVEDVIGGTILVVNEMRLEPKWRGFGLGPLLLAEVIESLRAGVDVVACYPMPLPDRGDAINALPHGGEGLRRKGQASLQWTWRQVGFEPLCSNPEVFALSLSTTSFDEHLQTLREEHQPFLDSWWEPLAP